MYLHTYILRSGRAVRGTRESPYGAFYGLNISERRETILNMSAARQELLAAQAREIAQLGKDLYARLSVMGGHVAKLGKNLDTAMTAYNQFVGSLESQVLTQARRFEALKIDTAGKSIEAPPVSEQSARPLTKLITDVSEAAE